MEKTTKEIDHSLYSTSGSCNPYYRYCAAREKVYAEQ